MKQRTVIYKYRKARHLLDKTSLAVSPRSSLSPFANFLPSTRPFYESPLSALPPVFPFSVIGASCGSRTTLRGSSGFPSPTIPSQIRAWKSLRI